jgi:glycosyltransferase involved in cell wall biosynthesis
MNICPGALELLRNPEQARVLGENARRVAEENYSWSAFLEKVHRVYGEFTGSLTAGAKK